MVNKFLKSLTLTFPPGYVEECGPPVPCKVVVRSRGLILVPFHQTVLYKLWDSYDLSAHGVFKSLHNFSFYFFKSVYF